MLQNSAIDLRASESCTPRIGKRKDPVLPFGKVGQAVVGG